MIRRLYPLYFYRFMVSFFKEIINYRFYRKTIDSLHKTGELDQRGLRLDSLKRVYYVKNLQPEALLYGTTENGGVETFEKQFIAESLRDHNEFFIKHQIIELVKSHSKRIKTPDYYAYLVWIGFKFKKIKIFNILYIVLYVLLITYSIFFIIHNLGQVMNLINWLRAKL